MMKDFDVAMVKFCNKLNITALPLSSWDVHSNNLQELFINGNELVLLRNIANKNRWRYKQLNNSFIPKNNVVVVTDSKLTIVHATQNILSMTGYRSEEILGRTPKMFQGKETSMDTLSKINTAIEKKVPFSAVVLNYKKDGSVYNCEIKADPIFNDKGQLVNYIAFEREVA